MSSTPIPADLPQTAAQTTAEHPWPLRLLSEKIREYVARMSRIWVEGEITSYQKRPGAKVQFLTLHDIEEKAAVSVKIFTHLIPPTVTQGSRVVVCAKPDFYTVNGSLSLWADEIRPVGVGDILARLEQLKARLAAEGLFSDSRKQRLPFLPRTIGLICGRNTKAREDVEVNSRLRWPAVTFEVREVQVQGAGAVDAMIPALQELDSLPHVDVIVLARGGGSVEDLLPFSDERLVRAVAAAHTPVVSAIGHEGDSPILDLVADLRASTPTDAAKRIVPDVREERAIIAEARNRTRQAVGARIASERERLAAITARPVIAEPQRMVEVRREDLGNLTLWLRHHCTQAISRGRMETTDLTARLRTLSPLSTLERGYAIIFNDSGVVSDAGAIQPDTDVTAVLARGRLDLSVRSTHA